MITPANAVDERKREAARAAWRRRRRRGGGAGVRERENVEREKPSKRRGAHTATNDV